MARVHDEFDIEAIYQPTCVNVNGLKFERFGYVLIGISTVIMAVQTTSLGPVIVWEYADDITTVLFTLELLVRIFEKGHVFFTEPDKNWNFLDSVVVLISLCNMYVSASTVDTGQSNGGAMKQMKALRTLRLLRLLRLCRVFKGIEKVNHIVDGVLEGAIYLFVVVIVIVAVLALLATASVACFAGAKVWLIQHTLPAIPKVD